MNYLGSLLWIIIIVLVVLLFGAAELLDWIGRLEIIERKWPRIWLFLNNKPGRLLLYLFFVALAYRDVSERMSELRVQPPVVNVSAPPAPIVKLCEADCFKTKDIASPWRWETAPA